MFVRPIHWFSRWMTGLLLMAFVTMAGAAASAEQKIALVIGNSAYPSAALKNPVNDAKAMAAKLGSLGFEVILRTDASQRDMTRAVSQFGQKLKGGSVGLFYFAGHGMQVRGKNYLIPIDAEIENEASTRSEAVDVDQILEQLGPARLSMVILDACRNNPFERRFRSTGNGGLAQIDAPTGTMLAYATAPGKVAYDGTGSNGLYTTELLKALDSPGLKVEDVFKQVRINVLKASDNQQIPWESSSLTGEFYFKPDIKPQGADVNALALAKERAELQKSLEDERRRREQDAELVRREMESLRKELLAMRQNNPPAAAPIAGPTAIAPPNTSAIPPKTDSTTTIPSQQVALVNVTPSITAAPARNPDWSVRIAQLEKMKGKLTFAKAFAVLFDISSSGDLEELIRFENKLHQLAYSHAAAVGIDSKGVPFLAYGGKFTSAFYARGELHEFCGKPDNGGCHIVVVNRDFEEKEFFSFTNRIRQLEPTPARQLFLEIFRQPMASIEVASGDTLRGSRSSNTSIFYSRR